MSCIRSSSCNSGLGICHGEPVGSSLLTRKKVPQETRWQSLMMSRWHRWARPSRWFSAGETALPVTCWMSTSCTPSSSDWIRLRRRGSTSSHSIRRSCSSSTKKRSLNNNISRPHRTRHLDAAHYYGCRTFRGLCVGQIGELCKNEWDAVWGRLVWVQLRSRVLYGGSHWRHLANTIRWSVRGCYAALCQITLITRCHYHSASMCAIYDATHCYCCRVVCVFVGHGRKSCWNG